MYIGYSSSRVGVMAQRAKSMTLGDTAGQIAWNDWILACKDYSAFVIGQDFYSGNSAGLATDTHVQTSRVRRVR